jgi:hypothetical protein
MLSQGLPFQNNQATVKINVLHITLSYCTVLAVLVGSQTKPLNLLHSFIADYTRRYYNRSITVLSRLIYNLKYRPEVSSLLRSLIFRL